MTFIHRDEWYHLHSGDMKWANRRADKSFIMEQREPAGWGLVGEWNNRLVRRSNYMTQFDVWRQILKMPVHLFCFASYKKIKSLRVILCFRLKSFFLIQNHFGEMQIALKLSCFHFTRCSALLWSLEDSSLAQRLFFCCLITLTLNHSSITSCTCITCQRVTIMTPDGWLPVCSALSLSCPSTISTTKHLSLQSSPSLDFLPKLTPLSFSFSSPSSFSSSSSTFSAYSSIAIAAAAASVF